MSRFFYLSFAIILLCGCSQQNEDTTSTESKPAFWPPFEDSHVPDDYGYLIDSPVAGIRYVSGKHFGITDETGRFGYMQGTSVRFYVGDIPVGYAVEPALRLTPYELADKNEALAIRIAQFLQTLDNDGSPGNGITLTDTLHNQAEGMRLDLFSEGWANEAAFLDQEIANHLFELTSVTEAGGRYFVNAFSAYEHFESSLNQLIDNLETELIAFSSQTECTLNEQCEIVELENSYQGYCAGPGPKIAYASHTLSDEALQPLIEERAYLISAKRQMQGSLNNVFAPASVCVIATKPYYGVCNQNQRCEIQYY